ncbi:MAG: HEAT repeat domain-containing protein [Daejeonella sp.]
MINFLSGISFFGLIAAIFWVLILFLCLFILNYLYEVNQRETKHGRWKFISDTLIRNAIFLEEDGDLMAGDVEGMHIPGRLKKLLPNPYFRKIITAELLAAKQNMSGTAATNLKKLFSQLKLDDQALIMLNSNSWHIKAAGIQQLGIMEMLDHSDKIVKLVNHKRQLIRVEAQNTLIEFFGFEGLRFLDEATYPISEWQQIRILKELSQMPSENFTGIDKWLKSANDSVVIFALKLAKVYYRFELYKEVVECLQHQNPEVRYQAILACAGLQTENTADQLVNIFFEETERNKITIINILGDVGTSSEFTFLLSLLENEPNALIIVAAHSLASLGDEGMKALKSHSKANDYPLVYIIKQIESEKK